MANEPQVHAINISKSHFGDMESQANARVIEDLGIEGDRYAIKRGMNRAKRQVLLMDKETLELLGLTPGTVRENITTQDMDLYSLTPGQKVRIGAEVELEITELCNPCERMDEIRQGLKEELEGRRGMLTRVAKGGDIAVGDTISVVGAGQLGFGSPSPASASLRLLALSRLCVSTTHLRPHSALETLRLGSRLSGSATGRAEYPARLWIPARRRE